MGFKIKRGGVIVQVYSNQELFQIAKKNYEKMSLFCKTLEKEGFWEKPEEILKEPITVVLDKYIQALLMNLMVYCGCFNEEEKKIIINLPSANTIGCKQQEEQDECCLLIAKKMMASPPILLQLCGVRDAKKSSKFTGYFFDALINVMLSLSYYNNHHSKFAIKFIEEYYKKVLVFLNEDMVQKVITPKYLFRKLSCDYFELEKIDIIDNKEKEQKKVEQEAEVCLVKDRKKKAVLSDEELQSLLMQGKLKIDAPKLKELQKQKKEVLETEIEETRINEIEKKIQDVNKNNRLESLLKELEQLIGLNEVKEEMGSLINLIKVRKIREDYQMPVMNMTYHMVFTGNPGTGKTTVARLVAQIYKELGVLSKGQLVETDRAGLVAGYIGQTALKVKDIVEQSIGGILFIDEAYALSNNDMSNDFGKEAIDTLVKMMEDNRDNLVVIVAGYKKEMEMFLKANTGLVSRFNKFIEFPDYSNKELLQIMEKFAVKSGVKLEEEAIKIIEQGLGSMKEEDKRNFGNARGIRNIFEKIMKNQANRIVKLEKLTQEELMKITFHDVKGVL